jgi:histidine triad (HIT) family protein
MSNNCIFCMILEGKIPSNIIYEDNDNLAFLDINPSAPGHTLIIPKHHKVRVEELTTEEATSLFLTLHHLVKPIREAMMADATTITINDGPESGQEVQHVHIHVIPRKIHDGKGVSQVFRRSNARSNAEDFKKIAETIKDKIL